MSDIINDIQNAITAMMNANYPEPWVVVKNPADKGHTDIFNAVGEVKYEMWMPVGKYGVMKYSAWEKKCKGQSP